jgi:hypothetical protein
MAAIQQDSSSVTGNYWSGTSTKNNSGAALRIKTTSQLSSVTSGLNTPTGSVVVDGTDTNPSLTDGTFAYNNQKPVAKRVTTTLATVSKTFLQSGAARPELVVAVNKIETVDTRAIATAIRSGYWNIYSGKFTTDPTVSYDSMHKSVTGTSVIDVAANVSRSSTGRLTYMLGAGNAVNSSYDSKRG